MSKPFQTHTIALAPRPWLTRETGECAFPVAGDGVSVLSCCNPCGTKGYCRPHRVAMRGPPAPPVADLEAKIMRWLERAR